MLNFNLNKFQLNVRTLGLQMPQTSGNMANCSQCGFKHTRLVRNRCKRTLNTSAPNLRDVHSSDEDVVTETSKQLNTAAPQEQVVASGASVASNSSLNFEESARH